MTNKPKPQPAPSLAETIFAQAAAIEIQQMAKVGRKFVQPAIDEMAELCHEAAERYAEFEAKRKEPTP